MKWLESIAARLASERFDIGRSSDLYLTRYTLAGQRATGTGYAVYLHQFHRGDYDDALHDHPWPFVSVILAGGYYEHTADRAGLVSRRWYGPGRVLVRPAEYRHRVELRPGHPAWSLVFRGRKCRTWFFHCLRGGVLSGKAVPWRSFLDRIEAGALGCGEG